MTYSSGSMAVMYDMTNFTNEDRESLRERLKRIAGCKTFHVSDERYNPGLIYVFFVFENHEQFVAAQHTLDRIFHEDDERIIQKAGFFDSLAGDEQ